MSDNLTGKICIGIVAIIGAVALIFFSPLMGALSGMFAAWVFNMFFPHTMAALLAWFGWKLSASQFGAAIGFVGGFLKSTSSSSSSKSE
jgi:hypothetical protein